MLPVESVLVVSLFGLVRIQAHSADGCDVSSTSTSTDAAVRNHTDNSRARLRFMHECTNAQMYDVCTDDDPHTSCVEIGGQLAVCALCVL